MTENTTIISEDGKLFHVTTTIKKKEIANPSIEIEALSKKRDDHYKEIDKIDQRIKTIQGALEI